MCLYIFFKKGAIISLACAIWKQGCGVIEHSYGGWIFRLGKLLMMQIMCKLPTWLHLTSYRKQLPINIIITYRQRLAFTLVYTWSRMVNFVKYLCGATYFTWLDPDWVDTGVDQVPILVRQAVVALFVRHAVFWPLLPFCLVQWTQDGSHVGLNNTWESVKTCMQLSYRPWKINNVQGRMHA